VDLQLVGRTLYIAMAGPHQIWQLELDKQKVSTFAGSGREADWMARLTTRRFAQPSALAADGQTLYVQTRKQISFERSISAEWPWRTLVGGNLFDFGDEDAPATMFACSIRWVWRDGTTLC